MLVQATASAAAMQACFIQAGLDMTVISPKQLPEIKDTAQSAGGSVVTGLFVCRRFLSGPWTLADKFILL